MKFNIKESPIQSNTGVWTSRKTAEFLLEKIKENVENQFLVPSYVAAICSGIEGDINTAYIDHFHKNLGKSYNKYVKPYLFMKVYDRLTQLPIIISNFKYRLNLDNKDIKKVCKLFELRNSYLHVKHMWHYADVYEDLHGNLIDIKYHDQNHPDPYRDWDHFVDPKELDDCMKLFDKFLPTFYNIAKRINRKNFNPGDWFIKI